METGLVPLLASADAVPVNLVLGFFLLLLGAACGGSFGLPSKFVKKDLSWEILWGPFFFFATILLPVLFGPVLVTGLFDIYKTVGWAGIALPLAFGLLWGFGSMTLGLSFAFIGLSLAYAINYGGQIIVGGIGPMAIHHREKFATAPGGVILGGIAICLLGVVVCGIAGILKSRAQESDIAQKDDSSEKAKVNIMLGLLLAFASGVLCACWSIGFSFGDTIQKVAENDFNNQAWRKSIPVTVLILWGGSVSSCLYCVWKLNKNKSWSQFASFGAVVAIALALIMALLHDGAVLLYGLGATKLGALGGGVGYAVFMSFAIIIGNFNGFVTGEWKGAGHKSVGVILAGVLVLILGVSVLGTGLYMDEGTGRDLPEAAPAESVEEPAPG